MRKSNTDFNISFLVPTSSPAVLGFFGATKIVRQAASFFAPPAIASPRTIVVQILRRKEKISDILKRDFGRGERINERMDERARDRASVVECDNFVAAKLHAMGFRGMENATPRQPATAVEVWLE